LVGSFPVKFEQSVRTYSENDLRRERRVKRQKPVNTKLSNEKTRTTKSLGVRYAELLKLRQAVSQTQSDLEFASSVERPATKEDRAFPYH
jgi:hypothetical protein